MKRPLLLANSLALLVPAALLAGAYAFQYIGGLPPCEMCWWQRYPHFAAILLALTAALVSSPRLRKWLVVLAALALVSCGTIFAGAT